MSDDKWFDDIVANIGENDSNQDVKDWLSCGFLPLNKAISGRYDGGFPVGRITEVFGGESSGKTLLATMALIETQRKEGVAVMLDYEHAFSVSRAEVLGLDTSKGKWIYKQPDTAEKGFTMLDTVCVAVNKNNPDKHVTVVIDSIAAMMTEEEMKAGYEAANMKTRLSLSVVMSTCLKPLSQLVNKTNVTLIFLNQTRSNPGVMFGDKETQPGGKAMKFYASVRGKIRKGKAVKDGDEIIGEEVFVKIIKNKVNPPFREAVYHSSFIDGIDLETSHLLAAKELGLVETSGNYLIWDGKKSYPKVLAAMMKGAPAEYAKLLALFKDEEVE